VTLHLSISSTMVRAAAFSKPVGVSREKVPTFTESADEFGENVFAGAVAGKYLSKHGLPMNLLEDHSWTRTHADEVAAAVLDWAKDHNASVITHWFQPKGTTGVRHGHTGQVHNAMFVFGADGKPQWSLDGSTLLKGETDGSSYPSGGLRATHRAGGYTVLDPSSPLFIRGDTVFVPSLFVSFYGDSLDEKLPLLRAQQAVSKQAVRLLKALGYNGAKSVGPKIGLEQEFFLVPRDAFYRRPDLQMTGRTVIGKTAARGQELCDHYMAPLNPVALECIKEIQHECMKIGIPLRTRHREVAPNQYEMCPFFGAATVQIDQNLMVMQIGEEVAARHGLACLFAEKPFQGINGSGKHNNFSLGTDNGLNFFNPGQMKKATGSDMPFIAIMAAVVTAIDRHGDLMRCSIATPGNEFRLGACEAPPAIMSTYLGEDMTQYLKTFSESKTATTYVPNKKTIDLGVESIAPFTVPAEDRNRTSPFPYGGMRFEFRAVGSSPNVSQVNLTLCSIFAEAFGEIADKIEAGSKPEAVCAELLETHWKCIFNGDGYDMANQEMLTKKGLWRIDSGVEAIARLTDPKNTALFSKLGVLTAEECAAWANVHYDLYIGTVEMEAQVMVEMIKQHVRPAAAEAQLDSARLDALTAAAKSVQAGLAGVHAESDTKAKAAAARVLRLETMEAARAVCDEVEAEVPAELWTLATYQELLFLDKQQGAKVPEE